MLQTCVRPHQFAIVILTAGFCAMCATGCESGVDRTDLKGNATFAGQPIKYGNIQFVPDTAQGHSGPAGNAEIVDGKYDTALNGVGIVPGPHLVRVTAMEERPLEIEDETLPSLATPPLFFNYAIESDLQGGTFDIEVPEEARGYGISDDSGTPAPAINEP